MSSVDLFDVRAGMSFSRTVYEWEALQPGEPLEAVSQDSVREGFVSFVRGEFGTGTRRGACPPQRAVTRSGSLRFSALEKLRDELENLVYGGYLDDLLRRSPGPPAEKLLAILSDAKLGNPANRKNISAAQFQAVCETLARSSARLRFVFLGFPFKDQNFFRTACQASVHDAAEVFLLIRLHALTLAAFQVLPNGVDWIALSDGVPYQDIFRVQLRDVIDYRQRLQSIRTRLNLTGSVHLIDLRQLVEAYVDERGDPIVDTVANEISLALMKLMTEGNEHVRKAMSVLKRGMKWNMQLRDVLSDLSWETAWDVLNAEQQDGLTGRGLEAWQHVDELAGHAAIRYAAFNLSLRACRLLTTVLPPHVRATAHAKTGQLAIPQLGDVFPWNGVGAADQSVQSGHLESVAAVPLFEILRDVASPSYFVLEDGVDPFLYVR